MIEFLRGWTLSLAGIIVFGSLCEMLLPNSVYKKYINLAIGLILCIAIVSPFVKGKTQLSFQVPSVDVSNEINESNDVIAVYTKKLGKSIEEEIKRDTDLKVSVKCQVSENTDNMGVIENVYIIVDAENGRKLDEGIINRISKMYDVENISVKYIKDTLHGD